MLFRKLTNTGKPLIERGTGLPIYTRSVNYRIAAIRHILTQGMSADEAKWFLIQNEVRTT